VLPLDALERGAWRVASVTEEFDRGGFERDDVSELTGECNWRILLDVREEEIEWLPSKRGIRVCASNFALCAEQVDSLVKDGDAVNKLLD